LQCVAVCCSVLQCVAVCCSVLQCVVGFNNRGSGGNFSKVKRLVLGAAEHRNGYSPWFLVFCSTRWDSRNAATFSQELFYP